MWYLLMVSSPSFRSLPKSSPIPLHRSRHRNRPGWQAAVSARRSRRRDARSGRISADTFRRRSFLLLLSKPIVPGFLVQRVAVGVERLVLCQSLQFGGQVGASGCGAGAVDNDLVLE